MHANVSRFSWPHKKCPKPCFQPVSKLPTKELVDIKNKYHILHVMCTMPSSQLTCYILCPRTHLILLSPLSPRMAYYRILQWHIASYMIHPRHDIPHTHVFDILYFLRHAAGILQTMYYIQHSVYYISPSHCILFS